VLQLFSRMKLIIGLGNPGEEYINTRHNAGLLVAEALSAQIRNSKSEILNKSKILIFKSQNFMNNSGSFVLGLTKRYKLDPSDLYIIHDDLDIKIGEYKIQKGHGPKDHNGLNDIYEKLGSDEFWHVRIGIDNRPLDNKPMGIEYVLQNFTKEERKTLEMVIERICKEIYHLLQ
jgi:PTH1 family peptidyl-tRNA hydrolase